MRLMLPILLIAAMALPVSAQEPVLEETFTAPDESFTFMYPADWELMSGNENGAMFSAPAQTSAEPNESGIGIDVARLGVIITMVQPEGEATAEAIAQAEIETATDSSVIYEVSPVTPLLINSHDAALIDATSLALGFRVIAFDAGDGLYVIVNLAGVAEQWEMVTPTVYEMIGSFRLAGDETPQEPVLVELAAPPLDEAYTRPDELLIIHYPAGWTLAEQGTYTLLIAPNDVEIGFSAHEVEVDDDTLIGIANDFVDAALQEYPSLSVQDEVELVDLGGRQAARVLMIDSESPTGFGYAAVGLDEDVIALVSIIGSAEEIQALGPVIDAIIAGLETP